VSGYVRSIEFDLEFEGERVTCKLKQMSFPDMLKLEATDVTTDEDAARVLAEIVPGYVTDFSGPKAADGSEVSIQEVCSMAYFTELAMAIGRKLVTSSRPPRKPS
jgi:hypothetical protein